jgi:hypothetical protein
MKLFRFYSIIVAVALIISACGAKAVPTIDPLDVQNTAVAAAFTMVAETQAAIPTATPVPPTETPSPTPLPTDTPIPSPSLEVTLAPTQQSAGNSDPCNAPLPSAPDGKPTTIKLTNMTKAPVTASLYLNLTPFGVCGYRGYNIAKGGAVTITDLPQGCYYIFVWINDPKKPAQADGYGCINNPDKWTFEINTGSVKFTGP